MKIDCNKCEGDILTECDPYLYIPLREEHNCYTCYRKEIDHQSKIIGELKEQLSYANSCIVGAKANIMNGTKTELTYIGMYMDKYIYIKKGGEHDER